MNLSKIQLRLITVGILLSLFLASMEGTVVATAMPTIVGQLGGLSIYSWVFSIYMLTSTATVPIYGKLSDIYGRKRIYMISMGLFLGGSVLCAQAGSMEQLVFFRAVQGIGAGGVLPLVFTIVGELFTLEERTRMQGLLSGVWGVSSVIGPLIGGFLVDQVSWQWVFLINVLPGLLAAGFIWFAWRGVPDSAHQAAGAKPVRIDFLGVVLLTVGVLSLLLGLEDLRNPLGWGLLTVAVLSLTSLIWVERRAADPILPFGLFRDRLFTVSILHGVFAGWAMFGSINFVPLFAQAVLGTTATQAGITLTPMSLAWTFTSILAGWLLLKVDYRSMAMVGMALLAGGTLLMSRISDGSSLGSIMAYMAIMGAGMGLSIPAFLIAVQSTVDKRQLGVATSTIQFSRSIGGTLGVSILGTYLTARLASAMRVVGLDPAVVSLDSLIDPAAQASVAVNGLLREALATAIASLFGLALVAALIGLAVVFLAPAGRITQLVAARAVQPQQTEEPHAH
jgi:EmrB/QacA subfamily drug resistance transporter